MSNPILRCIRNIILFCDQALAWPVCPFCRERHLREGETCCERCRGRIRTFGRQRRCPGCGGVNPGYLELCPECCEHGDWPWRRAVSAYPYETLVREAMIQYKYLRKTYFLPFFAEAVSQAWREHGAAERPDCIAAVPMHWLRKLQRGYNQAELLARRTAAILGIPYVEVLRRTRFTSRQARLNKEQRQRNLVGAFRCRDPRRVAGRSILLVDDVFTTGSTLKECSRILLKAGAAEVDVLTIARDE